MNPENNQFNPNAGDQVPPMPTQMPNPAPMQPMQNMAQPMMPVQPQQNFNQSMQPMMPQGQPNMMPPMPTKKPMNKKMIMWLCIGGGALILIVVLIIVLISVLGGGKLSCSGEQSMYGMTGTMTSDAYFKNNKLDRLENVLDVTVDEDSIYADRLDDLADTLEDTYDDITVTVDGNSLIVKESVDVDEDGDFDSALVKLFVYRSGDITREAWKKVVESSGDLTCK